MALDGEVINNFALLETNMHRIYFMKCTYIFIILQIFIFIIHYGHNLTINGDLRSCDLI